MNKAITNVSVAPVRAENSDKAEMVTQLLFGESVEILETAGNWAKIKTDYDGYEGWVDPKQISLVSEEEFSRRQVKILSDNFSFYTIKDQKMLLSAGSECENLDQQNTQKSISEIAVDFLNVPYLWGGRNFFGIDCSGFTQLVYKIKDIKLPRDAYQQAECGFVLDFIEEAEPGDLAFFENEEGRIIHVGIMLENQKIIHAHGKVRIDQLDSVGIFNKDQNKHTHRLRFIKRIN